MDQLKGKLFNQRTLIKAASLSAIIAIALFSSSKIALARLPYGIKVEDISEGSIARIRLEIKHEDARITDCGCSSHYVDAVEVDIDGEIKQFELKMAPQTSNPFIVELDLGETKGTLKVMVRAHCNIHGWSAWSEQMQISEFSALASTIVVAIFIFAALSALLFIRKIRRKQFAPEDNSAHDRKVNICIKIE